MPTYENFENDYRKKQRSKNEAEKPKSMTLAKEITEEKKRKLIDWITFYRRNIHRFVEHYFGIKLHPYQILWMYLMGIFDSFVAIASRAVGKSWLIGVFACAKAVLYPGSKIVIVSSTKEQAGSIISEKITELKNNYPNLAREIESLVTNANKYEATFVNGSRIVVVASRDSSRGHRATLTIYEEFRLIDKAILDAVIRPFAFVRQPPYLMIPEYAHLKEEPKEVFISSAYHKGLWWYDETITTIRRMIEGKNEGFLATDYLTAIRHNIKTVKQIEREKEKMDTITFLEEYENIPWGEAKDAYFKLSMFEEARKIKRAFYPQKDEDYKKKNPNLIKRVEGEIRVVSVDIATRKGKRNDNTIISCLRLLPTQKGYERFVSYIESHNGENTVIQTLRIKQIFYDFEADYLVLDLAQNGIGIYDQLGVVTQDDARGVEYDAFTVMLHESIEDKIYNELLERTLAKNPVPIVYPISASASLNNDINVTMRDRLNKKLFSFLVNENKAEDFLSKKDKLFTKNVDGVSEKAWLMHPYVQTSLLINECIGLSMKFSGGNIKLEEQSGARKDRYTSVSYANYFASLLDAELLRDADEDGIEEMLAVTGVW